MMTAVTGTGLSQDALLGQRTLHAIIFSLGHNQALLPQSTSSNIFLYPPMDPVGNSGSGPKCQSGSEFSTWTRYFDGMPFLQHIACDMTTEINGSSGWWAGLDPKPLPQELWHGFSALYNYTYMPYIIIYAISMIICGSCKDYLEWLKIQSSIFWCALKMLTIIVPFFKNLGDLNEHYD